MKTENILKVFNGTENAFINLTPHAVNVCTGRSKIPSITILPVYDTKELQEEFLPRVNEKTLATTNLGIFPITEIAYNDVKNLPDEQVNTYLIVSAMVRTALPERYDLLSPGEAIRNDKGQTIACKGFYTNMPLSKVL